MSSPTQRTLAECRKRGWLVEITEHWCPFSRRRKDLCGFGDALALTGDKALLIQTTTQSNANARVTKIVTECREKALAWLATGGRISVWGWKKTKVKRGGKAVRWIVVEREIKKETFAEKEP